MISKDEKLLSRSVRFAPRTTTEPYGSLEKKNHPFALLILKKCNVAFDDCFIVPIFNDFARSDIACLKTADFLSVQLQQLRR